MLPLRTNATWGLQRITQAGALSNQNAAATTYTYAYDDTAGEGVDIYIVDTGILTTHREFNGRARWGTSFVGTSSDGHGHGTHVSGTAAGTTYGVAKVSISDLHYKMFLTALSYDSESESYCCPSLELQWLGGY